ncbi:3963_t:CDS:2 [Cetraspora pellucida]|uniref:3963_t:CDS:1 n=1 Tax=Cetraspora pellucida TaxID=1433469 RepID=A0A9N9FVK6_9GLOM|nr:3963_t:CDS:2 [Cetraspora pellucida]
MTVFASLFAPFYQCCKVIYKTDNVVPSMDYRGFEKDQDRIGWSIDKLESDNLLMYQNQGLVDIDIYRLELKNLLLTDPHIVIELKDINHIFSVFKYRICDKKPSPEVSKRW